MTRRESPSRIDRAAPARHRHLGGFPLGIVLVFVANAGLNLVLGLLVARFLGPEAFGLYGIAFAAATVAATIGFDWIKLSATRFATATEGTDAAATRATLDLSAAGIALALAALGAGLVIGGADPRLPAALTATGTLAAIANGWFDYRAALARARFADRLYARLVLAKNAAAFVLMAGGAFWFGDPALVMAGMAVSAGAAMLLTGRALAVAGARPAAARAELLRRHLRYGLPLVAANAAFQLAPLLARALAGAETGLAMAGHLALATDLGLRLVASLGSAADIYLFQLAVRRDATEGREAGRRQIARNLALVAALLVPAILGYGLALPALERLVVPAAFQGPFAAMTVAFLPGLLAYGLVQYALNPVFQLEARTGPITMAALAGLAVLLALLVWLPRDLGPIGYAWAQSGGFLASAVVLLGLAARHVTWREVAPDLARVGLASGVMALALLPWRETLAIPGGEGGRLAAQILTGAGLYAFLLVATNAFGLRAALHARRRSGTSA